MGQAEFIQRCLEAGMALTERGREGADRLLAAVREEVATQVRALGLATSEEVAALRAEVEALRDGTPPPLAKKAAAKKAPAKKAGAKKAAAKKAPAKKAAAKKATTPGRAPAPEKAAAPGLRPDPSAPGEP